MTEYKHWTCGQPNWVKIDNIKAFNLDEIKIIFLLPFFSGDPAKICGCSQRSREIRSENQRDGIQFGRKQEKSGSNERIG